jgi:hypothetical protein
MKFAKDANLIGLTKEEVKELLQIYAPKGFTKNLIVRMAVIREKSDGKYLGIVDRDFKKHYFKITNDPLQPISEPNKESSNKPKGGSNRPRRKKT